MSIADGSVLRAPVNVIKAWGEEPRWSVGDIVAISQRFPVGHYRVPQYIRGKRGVIQAILHPAAVNNEQEGFGLNAGLKGHYYRVAISLSELWPRYVGSPSDMLCIEVFETWLERK